MFLYIYLLRFDKKIDGYLKIFSAVYLFDFREFKYIVCGFLH